MENSNTDFNLKKLFYSMPIHRIFYLFLCVILIVISLIGSLITLASTYTVEIPSTGGSFRIASTNNIRYIDPIFASNDSELTISKLVYSGLMRHVNDQYIYDIADKVETSPDNMTFKVYMKKVKFSDDSKLTSSDVAYTVELLADSLINSPRHKEWKSITTNVIDDYTIEIKSKTPIDNIGELLTQGIIKKSEWILLPKGSLSLSNLNISAIGAGPYKLESSTEQNKIINSLKLIINNNYKSENPLPYIEEIGLQLYANNTQIYDEIKKGQTLFAMNIDPSVIAELNAKNDKIKIETMDMYRTFGLFFNANNDKNLANLDYRNDLKNSINEREIINQVLAGYGKEAPYIYNSEYKAPLTTKQPIKSNYENRNISIYTLNNPDLLKVANLIKQYWAAIGVNAEIKQFEYSEFQQDIIKNRNYSVLLFAVDTNDANDIYNLWHSSGRNYPGTNITNYLSNTLDNNLDLLSKETNIDSKKLIYQSISDELEKNTAWIPLYTPYMIYSLDKEVKMKKTSAVMDKSSLLDNLSLSYIDTEKVYTIFENDTFYKKLQDFIK